LEKIRSPSAQTGGLTFIGKGVVDSKYSLFLPQNTGLTVFLYLLFVGNLVYVFQPLEKIMERRGTHGNSKKRQRNLQSPFAPPASSPQDTSNLSTFGGFWGENRGDRKGDP
jgi:hypothetical protein